MLLPLQNPVPFFPPSNHVFALSFVFKEWQSLEGCGGREVSCNCCISCIYPAGWWCSGVLAAVSHCVLAVSGGNLGLFHSSTCAHILGIGAECAVCVLQQIARTESMGKPGLLGLFSFQCK